MERSVRIADLKVGDVVTWSRKGTTGRVVEVRPFRNGDNGLEARLSSGEAAAAAAYTTVRIGGRTIVGANRLTVKININEEW